MRIWVFLLALSFALASHTQSEEPEDGRLASRLRALVERTRATKQPASRRHSEDQITERDFRQDCGPNEVVGQFGRCERALVTKNVFAFTAPKYRRPIVPARIPQPQLDLNVVFVKTAPNELPPLPLIVPPAQQKTVLYLLSKRPHFKQQLIEVPTGGPTEPEVFFVNYGSGENPSLPGGIDLETALRQSPLTGQIVSSPPAVQTQQGGFRRQPVQDFSFEDDNLQNNILGQSSVPRRVLSQSQGSSPRFVPEVTIQRQISTEISQQLSPFAQVQSSQSQKLQSSSSTEFGRPSSQFQSLPSNQFQPLPSTQLQSLPSNQFQSSSANQFQSSLSNQFQSQISDSFESADIQQQIPYANHLFESTSSSNQFQSPASNKFQSQISGGFESDDFQEQIPYVNHLFENPINNQFESQQVHSSIRGSAPVKNSDNSFESQGLQVLTRNELGSNKHITVAQNIHIDESSEFLRKAPANQFRTPSKASSSLSTFRSAPSKQYQSPSNSLNQDPGTNVQLLQPSQFGIVNDGSNERAAVKKKISSLPSGFVPAIPSQSPKKTLPSRSRFKPSQSIPNRPFKSPGTETFTPVPGSQYVLPPSDFQFIPPQDQSTASADAFKAPLVVQKLEPEQWEDVPALKSSQN